MTYVVAMTFSKRSVSWWWWWWWWRRWQKPLRKFSIMMVVLLWIDYLQLSILTRMMIIWSLQGPVRLPAGFSPIDGISAATLSGMCLMTIFGLVVSGERQPIRYLGVLSGVEGCGLALLDSEPLPGTKTIDRDIPAEESEAVRLAIKVISKGKMKDNYGCWKI